jgi:hypothetical protein
VLCACAFSYGAGMTVDALRGGVHPCICVHRQVWATGPAIVYAVPNCALVYVFMPLLQLDGSGTVLYWAVMSSSAALTTSLVGPADCLFTAAIVVRGEESFLNEVVAVVHVCCVLRCY